MRDEFGIPIHGWEIIPANPVVAGYGGQQYREAVAANQNLSLRDKQVTKIVIPPPPRDTKVDVYASSATAQLRSATDGVYDHIAEARLMNFELFVEEGKVDFVNAKHAIVTQRLQTALTLLLQELEAFELKRGTFIGKGISGDASIETALMQERAAKEHAEKFGQSEEMVREQQKEIVDDIKAAQREYRY